MFHAIAYFFGLTNGSGEPYLAWSGFVSVLVTSSNLSIFILIYRRMNCHQDGCFRLGIHRVEGSPFVTCRRHHPAIDGKITAEHIHAAHRRHLRRIESESGSEQV